jgi:hypothetical protein
VGLPSTSTDDDSVEGVKLKVQELADDCGISIGSCHIILMEQINMYRLAEIFIHADAV